MKKTLITIAEFMNRYSITKRTFDQQVNCGELRVVIIGGQELLIQTEVDLWLEVHRQLSMH